jgi:uncharacterized protein YciI
MSASGDPAGESAARYFLVFLTMVPGRTLSPELLKLHAAHLSELDRSGRLVLAGPVPEVPGGLIVLRVASLADARAIADDDPLVRSGCQTYAAGTWLMSNRQNGYQPDLPQEPNT